MRTILGLLLVATTACGDAQDEEAALRAPLSTGVPSGVMSFPAGARPDSVRSE
jgi:hypothetical protein